MKLLAIEARQNSFYYLSRYQQIVDFGAELFVLNGIGSDDFWPAGPLPARRQRAHRDLIRARRRPGTPSTTSTAC